MALTSECLTMVGCSTQGILHGSSVPGECTFSFPDVRHRQEEGDGVM